MHAEKNMKHMVVVGASGAIGGALVHALHTQYQGAVLHAIGRSSMQFPKAIHTHKVHEWNTEAFEKVRRICSEIRALDGIWVTNGVLAVNGRRPEKSISVIDEAYMYDVLQANLVVPALALKHFVPLLTKEKASVVMALSARVGSITDNRLGGWYSYRASKSALNMLLKTLALELARTHPKACVPA